MNRRSLNALVFVATMALAIVATDARQEPKPEVKKWDVAEPTGPTTALAFDTDEGTWMNVDVSPDGTQIVVRPARRHLPDADRRQRGASQTADEWPRVRHAAALQP